MSRDDFSGALDSALFSANFVYEPLHIEWDDEIHQDIGYPLLTYSEKGEIQERFGLRPHNEFDLPKFVPLGREDIEYLYARAGLDKKALPKGISEITDEKIITCFNYGLGEIISGRKLRR